jgi:hypothetical protein
MVVRHNPLTVQAWNLGHEDGAGDVPKRPHFRDPTLREQYDKGYEAAKAGKPALPPMAPEDHPLLVALREERDGPPLPPTVHRQEG